MTLRLCQFWKSKMLRKNWIWIIIDVCNYIIIDDSCWIIQSSLMISLFHLRRCIKKWVWTVLIFHKCNQTANIKVITSWVFHGYHPKPAVALFGESVHVACSQVVCEAINCHHKIYGNEIALVPHTTQLMSVWFSVCSPEHIIDTNATASANLLYIRRVLSFTVSLSLSHCLSLSVSLSERFSWSR